MWFSLLLPYSEPSFSLLTHSVTHMESEGSRVGFTFHSASLVWDGEKTTILCVKLVFGAGTESILIKPREGYDYYYYLAAFSVNCSGQIVFLFSIVVDIC
ncbi:hypothetical protein MHYP_G00306550 [Metynnis hypsauchen]